MQTGIVSFTIDEEFTAWLSVELIELSFPNYTSGISLAEELLMLLKSTEPV